MDMYWKTTVDMKHVTQYSSCVVPLRVLYSEAAADNREIALL